MCLLDDRFQLRWHSVAELWRNRYHGELWGRDEVTTFQSADRCGHAASLKPADRDVTIGTGNDVQASLLLLHMVNKVGVLRPKPFEPERLKTTLESKDIEKANDLDVIGRCLHLRFIIEILIHVPPSCLR